MDLQIIHVVLGKANPERMNGVNKVVHELASAQSDLGFNVKVWGISKSSEHNYPERNFETELFEDTGKFSASSKLREYIMLLNPENTVIHLHGGFIPQFFVIAQMLVKRGIKYNYTPHGAFNLVAMKRSAMKKKLYIAMFEKFLVNNAHNVHLIGDSEVDGVLQTFGKVNYVLIPNGQAIESSAETHSKIGNNHPVFGFVGRLDIHTKGIDLMLGGFAQWLDKSGVEGELWLIGDGPEKEAIVALARELHIEKYMKLLGSKYGDEKKALMKQMDFLCLFSRNEGLPGVVLEAAEIGLPSLISHETNMGRYITEYQAGFANESNSIDQITSQFEMAHQTYTSIAYSEMSDNAKKMVAEKFDWEVIAQQHVSSYA